MSVDPISSLYKINSEWTKSVNAKTKDFRRRRYMYVTVD